MTEGSTFFEGGGAVQKSLRKITKRLGELAIPYAVVGGMALFQHGLRRFTEDVDLLVTAASLKAIHERLEGLGYLPPFAGSKQLRDTETGVKIEFLVAGEYPGDGLPKPVSFPDPATAAVDLNGIPCVNLQTLVELKIASGMTGAGRLKDLADVEQLIIVLKLPRDYGRPLNPYVQAKYDELWLSAQPRDETKKD